MQQCGRQGLWGGEHVNFLGHGVSEHEAGQPALLFLEILDVATVDRGHDPARIDALMLLAIGLTNDTEIVAEPARIINLANEYAAGGLPDVIDMLKEGDADAIYNRSDNLEAAIKNS